MEDIKADYDVGGGWGNAIVWSDTDQFNKEWEEEEPKFKCYGFKRKIPSVGNTLKGEFASSWIVFEFVEVERCDDPVDMFFGKVKPIKQIMK